MLAFLDFEASSLSRHSYPIEVAWVFEDGAYASHLIRPAPGWDDWDAKAEAIHHIPRDRLIRQGEAHDIVANTMLAALAGHDLLASAPSWDGKWLSALLRAAGLPRHSLRLRNTDEALRETARAILAEQHPPAEVEATVEGILARVAEIKSDGPAHRALPDARAERALWLAVGEAARRGCTRSGENTASIVTQSPE